MQALGLQAHLFAAEFRLDQTVLAKFCADVAALGLRILITEMDIRDNELPAAIAPARPGRRGPRPRLSRCNLALTRPVIGVVTWGLSDRRTWTSTSRCHGSTAAAAPAAARRGTATQTFVGHDGS